MPSTTTFIVIALLVYGFTFAVTRIAFSTKEFKQQPVEDQERARKQLRWSLILSPFFLAGTYFLLVAPPEVVKVLPLVLYLLLWSFAFWILWRSYRLGVRRDTSLVKSMAGKPLRNAESLVVPFSLANLLFAAGIIAILVAIPMLRLQLNTWAPLLTVISSLYSLFVWHHERKNRV
ncbi:hypothetical protein [Diaphorobacter nitroreducens]